MIVVLEISARVGESRRSNIIIKIESRKLTMDETAKAQFFAELDATFAKIDTNGDGLLDKDEFRTAMIEGGPAIPGGAGDVEAILNEFFAQCDTNNDGKVSKDEFRTFFENLINAMMAAFGGAE